MVGKRTIDILQRQLKLSYFKNSVCGINKSNDLTVSLTSFPKRFRTLHICLKTLLQQSYKPKRLLLNLAFEDYKLLPQNVLSLQNQGLEIIKCKDLRSYKKLIPSLSLYPNDPIVTADDDLMYPPTWLEDLYISFSQNKNSIHCHRARLITFNQYGTIYDYEHWPNLKKEFADLTVVPIGYGGVLYPPGSISAEIFDENIFLHLCPNADDLWFKVMSLKNKTICKKITSNTETFPEIIGTQSSSLQATNRLGQNDMQFSAIINHYNLLIEANSALWRQN